MVMQDAQHDHEPAPRRRASLRRRRVTRRGGELLESAADRISLRERWLRAARMAPRIALVALAAASSYLIADRLLGHPRPFFAPISSVIVLGVTLGEPTRRAIQLALGVALGILVADLAVSLVGTGTWQVALIVFFGMAIVVFAGGDSLAANQAASTGVLLATLALPGDTTGVARFEDALIGAATALALSLVLFPIHPVKLARRALDPAAERIADVVDAVAEALAGTPDPGAAARAAERARQLGAHSADMRAALATSGETARLALARRGQRDEVERYTRALDEILRAQRDAMSLARSGARAIRHGDRVPDTVVAGLRDLATSLRLLPGAFADREDREAAREAALRAAAATTAGLDETRNLSVSLVVGQARMIAFDVLRATGLSRDTARAEIREAADADGEEQAATELEALEGDVLGAEIAAARPRPPT